MANACGLMRTPVVKLERLSIKIESEYDIDETFDFSSNSNFGDWCSRVKQEGVGDIYLGIDDYQEDPPFDEEIEDEDQEEENRIINLESSSHENSPSPIPSGDAVNGISPNKGHVNVYHCAKCPFICNQRKVFKSHFFDIHFSKDHAMPFIPMYRGSRWCPLCSKRFCNISLLQEHFSHFHRKKSVEPCPYCKTVFFGLENLRHHVNTIHRKEKPYVCHHCGFKTPYKDKLNVHIRGTHLGKKTFSCLKRGCSFSTAHLSSLNSHIVTKHEGEYPYTCPYCEYRAAQNGTMKRHIISKHTLSKPYKCPQCNFTCCHPTVLKYHVRGKHERLLHYECTKCDFKTPWKASLDHHWNAAHTKLRPYVCPHCPYSSVQSGVLNRHISAKHTKVKPFSCEKCEYTASRRCLLDNHVNKFHSRTHLYYKCNGCDAHFGTIMERNRHKAQNHVLKPLKCRFCTFNTLDRSTLRNHCSSKHKNRNLRLCSQCPYFTYHPGDIRRHNDIYHTDSPIEFKCNECTYKAGRQIHLDNHMKTWHTKEKPIPRCRESDKSKRVFNGKKHLNSKHRQKNK